MKTTFFAFIFFISLLSFAQQNPAIYIPCNGNAGDSSGNGHHGVISNINYFRPDRFNYPNRALGSSPDNQAYALVINNIKNLKSDSFTFSIWATIDSFRAGTQNDIIDFFPTSKIQSSHQLCFSDFTSYGITFNSETMANGFALKTNYRPIPKIWHHYVCTKDTNTANVYIDGVLKASLILSGLNKYSIYDTSSSSCDIFYPTLTGSFDDIRIYTRALNQSEVTNLYNMNSNTPVFNNINLINPTNNIRIVSEANNTTAITFNWNKCKPAVKYKLMLTKSNGTFSNPIFSKSINASLNDTTLSLTLNTLDSLLQNQNVFVGDSLLLKWTVFTFLNNVDSAKALQDYTIKVVRKVPYVSFNLLSPANNTTLITDVGEAGNINFNWQQNNLAGVPFFKLIKAGGSFTNPLINKVVLGNSVDIVKSNLLNLLQFQNVAKGDSVLCQWTVYIVNSSGADSIKSYQTFNLWLKRKRNLTPFTLITPANNSHYVVKQGDNTTLTFAWSASSNRTSYSLNITPINGSLNNAVVQLNNLFNPSYETDYGQLDNWAMTAGVAQGDSIKVKWAVKAYESTSDSLLSDSLNFMLVRYKNPSGINENISNKNQINIYPNPTDGFLYIDNLSTNDITNIKVFDTLGKEVFSAHSQQQKTNLNLSQLGNGIYYIFINNNDASVKLIKATKASSGADTATKMYVTVKKTILGWQGGISLGIDNGLENGSFDYVMYDGKVYNTAKLTGNNKMTIGFLTLEYKVNGLIEGIFSGNLQNSNGDTLAITEGKFYNLVEN
ncbi:MAG: SusE domain-containing protein [Bacteroidetes bacterium]|nr:SusE domain-containing protein [Bacteroidota bacterium]